MFIAALMVCATTANRRALPKIGDSNMRVFGPAQVQALGLNIAGQIMVHANYIS